MNVLKAADGMQANILVLKAKLKQLEAGSTEMKQAV